MKIKLEVISEKFKQLVIRNVIGNGYHMTVVQPNLIRLHVAGQLESALRVNKASAKGFESRVT